MLYRLLMRPESNSVGLRLHLVAFALAVLLPAAGLGAWAVAVEGERHATQVRLEDTARAVAIALDAEIRGRIGTHSMNAVKHGALSVPEGRVAVSWRLDRAPGGEVLTLR